MGIATVLATRQQAVLEALQKFSFSQTRPVATERRTDTTPRLLTCSCTSRRRHPRQPGRTEENAGHSDAAPQGERTGQQQPGHRASRVHLVVTAGDMWLTTTNINI